MQKHQTGLQELIIGDFSDGAQPRRLIGDKGHGRTRYEGAASLSKLLCLDWQLFTAAERIEIRLCTAIP